VNLPPRNAGEGDRAEGVVEGATALTAVRGWHGRNHRGRHTAFAPSVSFAATSPALRGGKGRYPFTNGKLVVAGCPMASNALATAGAMTGVAGSPMPVGGLAEGTR
jgi:hypothetical protein